MDQKQSILFFELKKKLRRLASNGKNISYKHYSHNLEEGRWHQTSSGANRSAADRRQATRCKSRFKGHYPAFQFFHVKIQSKVFNKNWYIAFRSNYESAINESLGYTYGRQHFIEADKRTILRACTNFQTAWRTLLTFSSNNLTVYLIGSDTCFYELVRAQISTRASD